MQKKTLASLASEANVENTSLPYSNVSVLSSLSCDT